MDGFMTIGELSKLRNVNRKSLRYYEEIGALIPAYTDPETKYRYYTLEQLVDLDTILLCLELGISLREAVKYKDTDGTLNIMQLLEDGKRIAQKKFFNIQNTLKRIELSLDTANSNNAFRNQDDFYTKHIGTRYIVRALLKKSKSEKHFKEQATQLFIESQNMGFVSTFTFPVGLMIDYLSNSTNSYVFLEVMLPVESDLDTIVLPEGDYLCFQKETGALSNPTSYFSDIFKEKKDIKNIIVTNMTLDKFENGNFPLEIQTLL